MAAVRPTGIIFPAKPTIGKPRATHLPGWFSPGSSIQAREIEKKKFIPLQLAASPFKRNAPAFRSLAAAAAATSESGKISGKCFVVSDNIDTDQIIPAEYLTLVPSKPDEYEKLGSYAMAGLPPKFGRFIGEGEMKTQYPVIIAGDNFGCGSSREHAPVALGAAGVEAIVAGSYARIFFRNSVSTGEVYPVESESRINGEFSTGDDVTVDMRNDLLVNHSTGKSYSLKPLGDAAPVIEAGGIFAYARKTGMIPAAAAS